jgi:hypothetical protein
MEFLQILAFLLSGALLFWLGYVWGQKAVYKAQCAMIEAVIGSFKGLFDGGSNE